MLRSEIVGNIKMRVYLSGMPELRLGLNDKVLFESTGRGKSKSVELEDVKFHQCVRLSRFENDRTISFVPPDGEFELMGYIWGPAVCTGKYGKNGKFWGRKRGEEKEKSICSPQKTRKMPKSAKSRS